LAAMAKKNEMDYKKLIAELIIVFIGVLGAFIVDSRLQSLQDQKTNNQTLNSIYLSTQRDTANINGSLEIYSYKERKLLADRFTIWLTKNEAPLDSLDLLLNHMTRPFMVSNLINHQILLRLPDINNLDNQALKFQILDYYSRAKFIEEMNNQASTTNSNVIIKTVDVETFSYTNGWPILNIMHKDKKVTMDKFLTKELKNRCLSYRSDCEDILINFDDFKIQADNLLIELKKELGQSIFQ
jgi:hypothetical protein